MTGGQSCPPFSSRESVAGKKGGKMGLYILHERKSLFSAILLLGEFARVLVFSQTVSLPL